MTANYPASLDSFTRPATGDPWYSGATKASTIIDNLSDALEAVEAMLGAGGVRTPVVLADSSVITVDASLGATFRVTLGGNRTLAPPTSPKDGQAFELEITQDGTGGRTLLLATGAGGFAFGTDAPSSLFVLSTTPGLTDYMRVKYNSTANRWHVVSFIRGF